MDLFNNMAFFISISCHLSDLAPGPRWILVKNEILLLDYCSILPHVIVILFHVIVLSFGYWVLIVPLGWLRGIQFLQVLSGQQPPKGWNEQKVDSPFRYTRDGSISCSCTHNFPFINYMHINMSYDDKGDKSCLPLHSILYCP